MFEVFISSMCGLSIGGCSNFVIVLLCGVLFCCLSTELTNTA